MKRYTITLEELELQALGRLLDAGVRASGLGCVHDASAILAKIDAAEPEEEAPDEQEE